jgi:hypothetical protein
MTFRLPERRVLRAVMIALLLTLLPIAVSFVISDDPGLRGRYEDFLHYDSDWYLHIADGYRSSFPPDTGGDNPSNVVFFPAYPLLGRWIGHLGIPHRISLPLAAHLACVGFWTYLLLLLDLWKVPVRARIAGIAVLASFPSAFFLVMGYSESLFLCALTGMIYWMERKKPGLAGLHGFVMTATKLIGLPLLLYPLLRSLDVLPSRKRGRRQLVLDAFLASLMCGGGALLFFAYCQIRFQHWDLYMITERVGWGVSPDYGVLFDARIYRPVFAPLLTLHPEQITGDLSRLLMALTAWLAYGLIACEAWVFVRNFNDGLRRVGLYYGAFVTWYISAAAMANFSNFESMSRHSLTPFVLLLLAALHLYTVHPPHRAVRIGLAVLCAVCVAFFAPYEFACLWRFIHGLWVA